MSRSGAFYFIEAMDGAAARGRPGAPARRAVHQAPAADRPDGIVRRVLTALRRTLGGTHGRAGRGRHRLGDAARAD